MTKKKLTRVTKFRLFDIYRNTSRDIDFISLSRTIEPELTVAQLNDLYETFDVVKKS